MSATTGRDVAGTGRFGGLLRRYRTAAGLTQVELAERAGYYVNYVRKLERGDRRPSRQVTLALARALNLSPEDWMLWEQSARHGLVTQPSLVGREQELDLVERRIRARGPGMILLYGGPGIGKTRLLAAVKRLAEDHRMLVLEAACKGESTTPFALVREALERPLWAMQPNDRLRALSGCERLSELIAETIGVSCVPRSLLSPEQELQLLSVAVTTFLTRAAGGRGIVLLVDDLHGADAGARQLLGRILTSSGLAMSVVATSRDVPPEDSGSPGQAIDELTVAGLVQRVPIERLTWPQAESVLEEMLGDSVTREHKGRLIRASGGVPGQLVALAHGSMEGAHADEDRGDNEGEVQAATEPTTWTDGVTPIPAADWCAG